MCHFYLNAKFLQILDFGSLKRCFVDQKCLKTSQFCLRSHSWRLPKSYQGKILDLLRFFAALRMTVIVRATFAALPKKCPVVKPGKELKG